MWRKGVCVDLVMLQLMFSCLFVLLLLYCLEVPRKRPADLLALDPEDIDISDDYKDQIPRSVVLCVYSSMKWSIWLRHLRRRRCDK